MPLMMPLQLAQMEWEENAICGEEDNLTKDGFGKYMKRTGISENMDSVEAKIREIRLFEYKENRQGYDETYMAYAKRVGWQSPLYVDRGGKTPPLKRHSWKPIAQEGTNNHYTRLPTRLTCPSDRRADGQGGQKE